MSKAPSPSSRPNQASSGNNNTTSFILVRVVILDPFTMVPYQLKFLIVGVDYSIEWIEAKVVAKITTERVFHFYWQKIMCMFRLPRAIVSDNRTHFTSAMVTNLCLDLGIQTKFVYVIHPKPMGNPNWRKR